MNWIKYKEENNNITEIIETKSGEIIKVGDFVYINGINKSFSSKIIEIADKGKLISMPWAGNFGLTVEEGTTYSINFLDFEKTFNMPVNVIDIISKQDLNYNTLKVIEECLELSEKLTKKLTKAGWEGKEPLDSEIIEEIGDVEFRLNILKKQLGWEDQVAHRIAYKFDKYSKFIREGTYEGRR